MVFRRSSSSTDSCYLPCSFLLSICPNKVCISNSWGLQRPSRNVTRWLVKHIVGLQPTYKEGYKKLQDLVVATGASCWVEGGRVGSGWVPSKERRKLKITGFRGQVLPQTKGHNGLEGGSAPRSPESTACYRPSQNSCFPPREHLRRHQIICICADRLGEKNGRNGQGIQRFPSWKKQTTNHESRIPAFTVSLFCQWVC